MFSFDIPLSVVRSVQRSNRADLVDKLVGLSLCPEYQANHVRILTLIHVALVESRGQDRTSRSKLAAMLNGLRHHDSGQNEDPAEDVFVSSVSTPQGQFRIFNGIYPASDYSLQRLLDAVLSREFPELHRLSSESHAILALGEAIANRCGFQANTFESSQPWRTRWPIQMDRVVQLGRSTRFSASELAALEIRPSDLTPFYLDSTENLLQDKYGYTALARRPILLEPNGVSVPIPSLVSPALRLHLAHAIAESVVPKSAIEA